MQVSHHQALARAINSPTRNNRCDLLAVLIDPWESVPNAIAKSQLTFMSNDCILNQVADVLLEQEMHREWGSFHRDLQFVKS